MEDVPALPSGTQTPGGTRDPSPSTSPPPEGAGPLAGELIHWNELLRKLKEKPDAPAAASHVNRFLAHEMDAAADIEQIRKLSDTREFATLRDAAAASAAGGAPFAAHHDPFPDPFAPRVVGGMSKAVMDTDLAAEQTGVVNLYSTFDVTCQPAVPSPAAKVARLCAFDLPSTNLPATVDSSSFPPADKERIKSFLALPASTLKPLASFAAILIIFVTLQCRMSGLAAVAIPAYWFSIGGLLFAGAAATMRVGQLYFLGHFPVQFNPATSFGFLFGPDEVKKGREKHENTARHWGFKEGLSTLLCRTGWIYSALLSCMPPILCANTNFIDIHSASAAANAFNTAGITSRWQSTFALTLIILFFQAVGARYVNVVSTRVGRFLLPALRNAGRVFSFKTTATIGGAGWGFPRCTREVSWCAFIAGSYTCVFVMGWHFCTISDVVMLKNVLANYVVWRELVRFPLTAGELKELLVKLWPIVRQRGELLSKDEQLAHPHFTSTFAQLSAHSRRKVLEYIETGVKPFDALHRAKLSLAMYTCGVTLQQARGETFDEFHCRAEAFSEARNVARVEAGGLEDWEIRVRVVCVGEGELSFALVYPVALF